MDEQVPTPPAPPEMPEFTPPEAPKVVPPSDDGAGKILAGLGYIIGVVALVAILIEPYKNDRFVRHHAIQALGLWVGGIALSIVSAVPIIGWIVGALGGIALFVLAVMGAIKAFQGEYYEVPVVYGIVKQYI